MTTKQYNQKLIQIGAVALVTLLFLGATRAAAHEITRERGVYLGVMLLGSSLDADDTLDDEFIINDDGGGISIRLGYLFNPKFSLELALGGHGHETSDPAVDAVLGTLNLFGYYHFAPGRHFRPFIKGGIGGYGLGFESDENKPSVSGGGLAFGGGFEYFLTNHFTLGLDLTHHIIKYAEKEIDLGGGVTQGTEIDEKGSATTLGLFLTLYI